MDEHFVCPDCGAESHHPKDLEHRYCARCNKFFPGGEPVGPEAPGRQAQQQEMIYRAWDEVILFDPLKPD